MSRRFIIDRSNMEALLEGVRALGTAGGGNPEWGRVIMERDFDLGLHYELIDPEDVADDSLTVSGGFLGSVVETVPWSEVVKGWDTREYEPLAAMRMMEETMGRKVDHVIPFELGGLNTPAILSLGARAGLSVIDGDGVGRAAPETHMASFIGYGATITPMPLVDRYGNRLVVHAGMETTFPDEVGRWLVTKYPGMAANAHYAMAGTTLKKAVIPNSITESVRVGQAILAARASGANGFQAFCAEARAREAFVGEIASVKAEDRGGFYHTLVDIAGSGAYSGRKARLGVKNETMVFWIDDKLKAVFPDLACILDPVTGEGLMSIDLKAGMPIGVAVRPCHDRLRAIMHTDMGKQCFYPHRYGFPDLSYIPLEELWKD